MSKSKVVLAEIDEHGDPVRIFRTVKAACQLPVEKVAEFPRALAVGVIRRKVFARARCTPSQPGSCQHCGATIVYQADQWANGRRVSGEMNEIVPRGKGGEVSVENGEALCNGCHTGRPNSVHGQRRWQSARIDGPYYNVPVR